MTSGGDSYDAKGWIEFGTDSTPPMTPAERKEFLARQQRILLDDNREDTCGCSRAGWTWFRGVTLLGWIVVVCLAWWLAAKAGWEIGLWIGSWA